MDGVVWTLLLGFREPAGHGCGGIVGDVVVRDCMVILIGSVCGDRAWGWCLVGQVGAEGGGGVGLGMSVVG